MDRAWHLIHDWRLIPGANDRGEVDGDALQKWLDGARSAAASIDRLEVCDVTIGELLAKDPETNERDWPSVPVRESLEKIDTSEIVRGFVVGIRNKHGSTVRGMREGGRQERELAAKYDRYAEAARTRWPRTGAALKRVANEFREEAKREDAEAEAAS